MRAVRFITVTQDIQTLGKQSRLLLSNQKGIIKIPSIHLFSHKVSLYFLNRLTTIFNNSKNIY